MAINFSFIDYCKITKPSEDKLKEFKDFLGMPEPRKGLRVVMEASHSGILNRNHRIYIPSRMEEGVSTFKISEKPTKILKHHDLSSDPVGVVRAARYVPTIPQELKDNKDIATLCNADTSIQDQLKSIKNLLKDGLFNNEEWKGLGYIELIADIYDKETIEQLQDGRLDAVSTHFESPGSAYCLLCGQNWAKDGLCDHLPFNFYPEDPDEEDSIKLPALPIPGVHNYLETSFVTIDGDQHTAVKIMDVAEVNNKEIFEPKDSFTTPANNTVFEFKDHFKEESMSTALKEREKAILETIKKLRPEIAEDTIVELASPLIKCLDDNGMFPNQEEAELDDKTAIEYLLDSLETQDQEIDANAVYSEMEADLSDAKLSSEAREKLPDSVFCGPNRSFPVPDCAHVTAARKLIGRYKGPGDKTNILACVNRKAKALGCGSDSLETEEVNIPEIESQECQDNKLKAMDNKELFNLYHSIELELIDRKEVLRRECSSCVTYQEEITNLKSAIEDLNKMSDNKDSKFKNLEQTLSILRDELKSTYADFTHQVDLYVEQGLELQKAKAEKLALVGVLDKKYENLESAIEDLKTKDLDKTESLFMDSFDINKFLDKTKAGMSNIPEGELESPVLSANENKVNGVPDNLSKTAQTAIEVIKELISLDKIMDAHKVYAKMKAYGEFPESLMFESFSAEESAE